MVLPSLVVTRTALVKVVGLATLCDRTVMGMRPDGNGCCEEAVVTTMAGKA